MWELIRCNYEQSDLLTEWLNKGYEPFAISQDLYHTVVWLKKELPSKEEQEKLNFIFAARMKQLKMMCEKYGGCDHEVLHKPAQPKQRRGRPATVTTKS